MTSKTTVEHVCAHCHHFNVWPLGKHASFPCGACGRLYRQLGSNRVLDTGEVREGFRLPSKAASAPKAEPPKLPVNLAPILAQLDAQIGLRNVKTQVMELTQLCLIQQARTKAGLGNANVSKHLVFTGAPGTGKTTVARIIGEIYHRIGLTRLPKVVETDRAGMVAAYVGQTALKTTERITEAMGGILFIDEAYSLHEQGNGFGKEAIDTLLKAMEDHRGDLCVIVAGYPDEMTRFIRSNPGLESRFNSFLHFDNYTASELCSILKKLAADSDYELEDKAMPLLQAHFSEELRRQGAQFSNGRYARNLFEKMITSQALRLGRHTGELSSRSLKAVNTEDVSQALRAICGKPYPACR
ncbi:AAA family ATPase [Pseudoduganella violaceinigra]|uniref:AAA family ATPase n=1 Tax=Pseudoduganella violaceinigra TaxID=246602 RepID=UPI0009FF70D8|nr:AAA family ATPase [Pseudoduganella violaceinigra]